MARKTTSLMPSMPQSSAPTMSAPLALSSAPTTADAAAAAQSTAEPHAASSIPPPQPRQGGVFQPRWISETNCFRVNAVNGTVHTKLTWWPQIATLKSESKENVSGQVKVEIFSGVAPTEWDAIVDAPTAAAWAAEVQRVRTNALATGRARQLGVT